MERHTRLSRAAVVLVAIALIASIAAAVWFASPDAPYVPSKDSGAALGAAAPAEDGTVAGGYQPSSTSTGISDNGTDNSAITTIRNSKSGSYYLTSNIVVNSLTDCTFTGTLDGNGKTIYIRYDSDVTGEPVVNTENGIGALFGNLDGATIKNAKIVVETFRYVEGSAGTRNVGIIAGDAWGGVTIENVYVELKYSPTSNGRSYFLDSGAHSSWPGIDVELNFGAVLGKSGSSDAATTDVTLKNVTVDNQTSGNYGFSAWIRHGDYCDYKVSMGHFVGWVAGELSMQNCTLRGGESAKMTIERGGSGGSTTNQSGAVIGRLDQQSGSSPSLTIDGLDMELAINFDDHAVMNNISGNNGIIYGNDANNSWTVTVKDIYWNQNSGNPGWYDGQGNDTITYSNLTKYDPNVIDISFDKDGDKVLLSAKAQYVNDASSIVKQIVFNGNTYTVWDKLIATGADTVGQWTQVATVDAPNSSNGGNVTYTTMGTGTFSLEGGETITGVSGNSYTAEREYDGNAPQSPSVVLSDNGGSYADVWKTTNASANVGQYTMTFDKNAFTDAVVATGSDNLTYVAANGIVYSPGSMEQIGQLNIVNNINVNITKASVTVTPRVPTGDLYAGNPMPEITATAVDSGGSPVEGDIAWDDPAATLLSGKHSYNWTWTPTSKNYPTKTGSMELEAFDRKIESLTVQGDFKKAYTAYEPFDPTGIEVIAHYSDGSSEQLVNDEYEFTVVNGDKDRLIVGNNTVTVSLKKGSGASTTITITVSKLAVDVPIANQGLVYNGAEQIGVAASADNYYSLSGNTGTNAAADYAATATLTDKVNTRWDTDTEDDTADKSIPWSIAKKDVAITVMHTSKTYDGQEVDPTTLFTAQGVNNDALALTVAVDGGKTILNAGTYSVTASLADSETNYTADPVKITYTVNKKGVQKPIDSVTPYTYNSTEQVVTIAENADYTVNGTTAATDAGNYSFTIALTDKANTEWEGGTSDDITVTWSITPATVEITGEDSSKPYDGEAVDPRSLFTAQGVNNEGALQLEFAITVDDENSNEILNAGTYTVTASLAESVTNYTAAEKSITFTIETIKVSGSVAFTTSETYDGTEKVAEFTLTSPDVLIGDDQVTITYSGEEDRRNVTGEAITATAVLPSSNYDWVDGITPMASMTIIKATPAVTVELSDDMPGNLTVAATLDNAWLVRTDNTGVEGTLAWDKAGELLQQGDVEYGWTFVPTDSNNYNNVTGFLSITASEDTLQSITVKDGTYKTEYTAYEDFDPTGLVVIARYASGTEVEVTSGFTFENDKALTDGQITVTLNGVSTTITVTVNKREIPLPAATEGLIFNGEEQNGIDQKWIEQYAEFVKVEGNSQRDAGDYRATVTLTKDTNYVTWKGGSTDAQTIDWSIAKMVVSGEIVAPESLVYDGSQKEVSFDGQLAGNDEFDIAYYGDHQNVTADGFTVTVSLPNDNNYEWADGVVTTAAYKIEPKRVYLGHGDYTWGMSYNGVGVAVADLGGNTGDGNADLVFAYEDETLETKLDIVFDYVAREANGLTSLVDAGEYTIEFNLADSVVNYVADPYTTTLEITPMRVEATLTAPNEVYTGNEKNAILTVKTQLVGEDKVTVEYNNVNRIDYTGEEIVATAQLPNDNYVWADGTAPTASFTIQKAKITSVTVTVSDTPDGGWTTAMMPEFTSVSVEPDVEGEVVWDNGSLIAGENAVQRWTFVPATNNYEPYHGSVTLTVSQATLTGVSVEVKPSAYVAFDKFDRSSIAVEARYGEDRKPVTTGYTLTFSDGSTEDKLLAGTGITVTVTYTDGDVTQSTEFTIDVAKRTVAKPVVGDTTFEDNGGQITLEIAPSKFYTVTGNTGFGVGSYQAKVSLVDADNTMWEDGSTDDVLISWTITEPVTSDEVIADILAMEKVTWQNAEEFLDLEARYNALDESEQTSEATAKLATLKAQYGALRNAAFDDIEAAHEVTAKSLGRALAAAAAGLSAAAIALAIAKRRSI